MAEHSVAPSGLMLPSAFAGVSPLPVIFSALRASAALPFAKMCIKSRLHRVYIYVEASPLSLVICRVLQDFVLVRFRPHGGTETFCGLAQRPAPTLGLVRPNSVFGSS